MELRRVAALASGALVVGGAATACSLMLDTSREQCTVDADCAIRGGQFVHARCVAHACVAQEDAGPPDAGADAGIDADPAWACVGAPLEPPASSTIKYDVHLLDFTNQTIVTSMRLRVCPRPVDVLCDSPPITAMPDPDGHYRLDIDVSSGPFAGYLAFDPVLADGGSALVDAGPDSGANDDVYLPMLVYFSALPLRANFLDDYYFVVSIATLRVFAAIYQLAGPDRNLGIMFLVGQDCLGQLAPGLSYELDVPSQTAAFYLEDGGIPSPTLVTTGGMGTGGFFGVPVGARFVTARLGPGGQVVASGTAFSIAGKLTSVNIGPSFMGQ